MLKGQESAACMLWQTEICIQCLTIEVRPGTSIEAASIHILIPGEESSQSKQWIELACAKNKMEVSIRIIDPHEFIWIGANPDPDQERHAQRGTMTKQRNKSDYFYKNCVLLKHFNQKTFKNL